MTREKNFAFSSNISDENLLTPTFIVPTLVLLPGMDGTGSLFVEFVATLPSALQPQIVSYPPDQPLGYAELTALVSQQLPRNEPFLLLGESFSGPVALALAAQRPSGLRGLVLVSSFAKRPACVPGWLRPMVTRLPVTKVPTRLAAALLLGRNYTPIWQARLKAAMSAVSAATWQARLKAILDVDLSDRLPQIKVPVLYLQATHDRVVSPWALEHICRYLPKMQIVRIAGPHFLLQARPLESAAAIYEFARKWGLVS